MTRVRYLGDGDVDDNGVPKPCLAFGLEFPVDVWVETDAPLSGNPMFEVDGEPPPKPVVVEADELPAIDGELDVAAGRGFADEPIPDPLDHDGDGKKGGSLPSPEPEGEPIPANWRELHWKTQVKLASKITGFEVENKADAVDVLQDAERRSQEGEGGE